MACSQAWISYNLARLQRVNGVLWLALRHGLVTIARGIFVRNGALWLALRHGLVTIPAKVL